MYRWNDGRKPIKKLPRWAWAILVLLLFYSILYANIPASANSEQIFIEYVVEPGDTLWTIAKHYRPDADPRETTWLIQQENDCGSVIYPGQVLRVPVGGGVSEQDYPGPLRGNWFVE